MKTCGIKDNCYYGYGSTETPKGAIFSKKNSKKHLIKESNKEINFQNLVYSFAISKEKNNILKILREKGIEEKTFHHRIDYEFKWAKYRFLEQDSKIPRPFRSLLYNYFSYLITGSNFGMFLSTIMRFSCSDFKVKYLKRGGRKKVFLELKNSGLIKEYRRDNLLDSDFPFLYDLLESTAEIEDFMNENKELNKDRHDRLEAMILLENDNVLAIEPPFFDKSTYITGHIDLIMYANSTPLPILFPSDYKPNITKSHNVVEYLPQLCMYGFLMRKTLDFNKTFNIMSLIFNREYVWIFEPDLIFKLPKIIKKYYNPNYFYSFKDRFGKVQDYLLIDWSSLCNLKALHTSNTNDFTSAIIVEFNNLLNLKGSSFHNIGKKILNIINSIKNGSPLNSDQEIEFNRLRKATKILFTLNLNQDTQKTLILFFSLFYFDPSLWDNRISSINERYLKILHDIQKICYTFSRCFQPKMINHGEAYKFYLVSIFLLTNIFTNKDYFTITDIKMICGKSPQESRDFKRLFIYSDLIKRIGYEERHISIVYILSKKGKDLAKLFIELWKEKFKKEWNIFFRLLKKNYKESKKSIFKYNITFDKDIDLSKFYMKVTNINYPKPKRIDLYFPEQMGDIWKKYLIIIKCYIDIKKKHLGIDKIITFALDEVNLTSEKHSSSVSYILKKLHKMGFLDFYITGGSFEDLQNQEGSSRVFYWFTKAGKKAVSKLPSFSSIEASIDFKEDLFYEIHGYGFDRIRNQFKKEEIQSKRRINKYLLMKIDEGLFDNYSKWKMWLNFAYHISRQNYKNVIVSSEIKKISGHHNPNIIRALDKLTKQELLRKEKKDGIHRNFYFLTEKGERLAKESPTFDEMFIKFNSTLKINENLFKKDTKWKMWLNFAYYVSNKTLKGCFGSKDIIKIFERGNDVVTTALNRLVKRRLLIKEKRDGNYHKNVYCLTEKGERLAKESPTFNDMVSEFNIPIIEHERFRGKNWEKVLIVAGYITSFDPAEEIDFEKLSILLNVKINTIAQYLDELYHKKYLSRKEVGAWERTKIYIYRINSLGKTELKSLPSYEEILK